MPLTFEFSQVMLKESRSCTRDVSLFIDGLADKVDETSQKEMQEWVEGNLAAQETSSCDC